MKRPRLLLLDEPLSALDRKVRAEMQLELKRLQHEVGITFVVVTHDQEEAMSMADRIAVMSLGQVLQIDTPIGMYQRPSSVFVADFIGTSNMFAGVAAIGGVDVPNIGLLPGKEAVPAVSGAAYLMVRPEDIQIVEGAGLLTGTVLETQFFGGASTIAVLVPGHEVPVVLTCHGSASVSRGAIAHLAWPADKAVVLNR